MSKRKTKLDKLESCPFCGEAANSWQSGSGWFAGCLVVECTVNTAAWGPTEEIAIERWNTRKGVAR